MPMGVTVVGASGYWAAYGDFALRQIPLGGVALTPQGFE